ncbi:MAG: cation transporter [Owenweeksia sp.]|nr:cation transporter [Owenweeksia sp.]
MKIIFNKKIIALGIALLFSSALFAQTNQDTTMIVNGVCGMCQATIETAAADLDGVDKVHWNKDTKVLKVSYNAEKLSLMQISDAINASGYDTEYNTAPEEAYQGLHKCCYYRDPKVIEDHKKKEQ